MRLSAFALLALSLVVGGEARAAEEAVAPAADVQRVQADARRLVEATYAGDVDVVLELTHPALIEQHGSRAEARRQFAEAMDRLKRIGLKIEVFEFPEESVISATREKNALLNPELIVQFTGGVWNPLNSSYGPVFQRGRGW